MILITRSTSSAPFMAFILTTSLIFLTLSSSLKTTSRTAPNIDIIRNYHFTAVSVEVTKSTIREYRRLVQYETPNMSILLTAMIRRDLLDAESSFRRACEQVFVLNSQVTRVTKQYDDADGNKIRRYNLRLRLSVLEGVRNMFYEFAAKKADDIVLLQRRVLEGNDNRSVASGDSDSDMSELAYGYDGYNYGSGDDADGMEYC